MKKSKIGSFFLLSGIIFILLAAALLIHNLFSIQNASKYNEKISTQIISLISEQSNVEFDKDSCSNMPVMQVDGNDYFCVLDVPRYKKKLPVLNEYQNEERNISLCRYPVDNNDGSLYIFGFGISGQFDFLNWIETDDTVYLMDMNGYRYSFTVTDIEKTSELNSKRLTSDDAALTLMVRENLGFDYLIVRCKAS